MKTMLDATDIRLLDLLQQDASLSNKDLAERAHVSPATGLRRIRRLTEAGIIERQVAILAPDQLGSVLLVIVEITLDQQSSELQRAFESRVVADATVQQCYQVSAGADFVLVLQVRSMEEYHQTAHNLFSSDTNVRNVRAFFSVRRAKFLPQLNLSGLC